MAKRKATSKTPNSLSVLLDFVDVADIAFERLTGKTIVSWLKEFQQRPKELPQGEQAASSQPSMPLADAYAIMGLPQTASLDQVKKRYRVLARLFHPDAPGGYVEAMKLLNNARERIVGEKGGK